MNSSTTFIKNFFARLERDGIAYCHWKSNFALAQSLAGELDLDLLVARDQMPAMNRVISDLGFKHAVPRWGTSPAGISHYYGFDPESNTLVHLHLFTQVMTGESFVKSHLLPFSQMLLSNVEQSHGLRVVDKSAELLLFTVRMMIKYGSPLDLLYLRRKQKEVQEEAQWLLSGAEMARTHELVQQYCPVIEQDLFDRCVMALSQPTPLRQRMKLARQVRRRLGVYSKYTATQRLAAYVELLSGHASRWLAGKPKNKQMQQGGAVIAFVGPEATGKSTLVRESANWLGSAFTVRTVHAGKPPTTWLTAPLSLLTPLMRKANPELRQANQARQKTGGQAEVYRTMASEVGSHESEVSEVVSDENGAAKKGVGLGSLIYAVRSVALAWERRQLLVKMRRQAAHGEFVICDRYPSNVVRAMDSRRLERREKGTFAPLYNWLAQVEEKIYRQIPPPDLVLRLHVSVETAKQRNRDRIKADKEGDSYLEFRHRQYHAWQMPGVRNMYDISTERSLAETLVAAREAIWEGL